MHHRLLLNRPALEAGGAAAGGAGPGAGGGFGGRGGRRRRRWLWWTRRRRRRWKSRGAARAALVPNGSQRHAAVWRPRRRGSAGRPRGRGGCADRQGTRRDVRQPPLLALADAGELLPRLQHDAELERPGCRPRGAAADDDRGALMPNGKWQMANGKWQMANGK